MGYSSIHSSNKTNWRQDLLVGLNQSVAIVSSTDSINISQMKHFSQFNDSTNRQPVKMNAMYRNIPDEIGELILGYFAPQNLLYEKAGICKLMIKHGRRALKDSVEEDAWIIHDESSAQRLSAISAIPYVSSSITKIKMDILYSGVNSRDYEFCKKLCSLFRSLETLVFGPHFMRKLLECVFLNMNTAIQLLEFISSIVRTIKLQFTGTCAVILSLTTEEMKQNTFKFSKVLCKHIFLKNEVVQEITFFENDERSKTIDCYIRADFANNDKNI